MRAQELLGRRFTIPVWIAVVYAIASGALTALAPPSYSFDSVPLLWMSFLPIAISVKPPGWLLVLTSGSVWLFVTAVSFKLKGLWHPADRELLVGLFLFCVALPAAFVWLLANGVRIAFRFFESRNRRD